MERDAANTDRARARAARTEAAAPRHINALLLAGIAVFAATSFYLAIVVASHLDNILLFDDSLSVSASIPGVQTDEQPDVVTPEDRINILVMGLDLRRDEDPDIAARTDTVFIFTIDPYSKSAAVLSIPRDLAVSIPYSLDGDEYNFDRVNTAYVYGENQKKGDGPKYTVKAVEHTFDIPIDYYAVLNFNNFIDIVDELGGIDIEVPEYVWDTAYNDCNRCGYYYVEFEPGMQHMDGETALTYARLRHSDNDFKRIERQQLVMRAIAKKAASGGWLAPDTAVSLFSAYKDAVKTDVPDTRLPGLAKLGRDIGPDNILMESLSEAVYPCPASQCNGAAILLPIPEKVDEVKARVFGDGRLQQEAAAIKIVNATQTPKLGADFAAYLRSQGIASDRISVDELANGYLTDQTIVIVHKEYSYTPERIAEWLGFDDARVFKFPDLAVETQARFRDDLIGITVVLGADANVPDVRTVSDYVPDDTSYYSSDTTDDTTDYSAPEETVAPEPEPVPEPEPTPEPAPEPTPESVPEPTAAPPPATPLPESGNGNGNGNGNGHRDG